MANLKQIGYAIEQYRIDNSGWVPITTGSDGARDEGASSSVWFQKLSRGYLNDPRSLVCPDDPLGPLILRTDPFGGPGSVFMGSSYGMNEFIQESAGKFLCNLDRYRPLRQLDTLLIGDIGPDVFYSGQSGSATEGGTRFSGVLPWDDSYDPGNPNVQISALTARHLGAINVWMMAGGNVQRVVTRPLMNQPPVPWYEKCAAGGCTLCLQSTAHYSFAASRTFWWTGPVPTP
ncbi:MAG: hypothetical protein V2A79_12460 [Planctomycetota bacterium]